MKKLITIILLLISIIGYSQERILLNKYYGGDSARVELFNSHDTTYFGIDTNGNAFIQDSTNGKVTLKQIYDKSFTTYTPVGTDTTIDLSLSRNFILDLNSASDDVTVTFNNQTIGGEYTVYVIQDAGTPIDVVWTGGGNIIKTQAGTTPEITQTVDAIDIYSVYCVGATTFILDWGENYTTY